MSFDSTNFVNLSTTIFIQRFFSIFYFFHKNAFLPFLIFGVNVFYIDDLNHRLTLTKNQNSQMFVMHTKTVILLENYSLGLNNLV